MLERLLRKAGTLPAMRVLDIGSGAGDVAAELLAKGPTDGAGNCSCWSLTARSSYNRYLPSHN